MDERIDIIKNTIYKSVDYLANSITINGKFRYGFDIYTLEEIEGYNTLRHAGCIWAIYKTINNIELNHNKQIKYSEKAFKALEYLKNVLTYIDPESEKENVFIIDKGKWYKVGGNALSILALVEKRNLDIGDDIYLEGLEKTLIDTIDNNGDLYYYRKDIKKNKIDHEYECDFYPGEVALALCNLSVIGDKNYFLKKAGKVIQYYQNLRSWTKHIRDHWMLQAIEFFGDTYIDYAKDIVNEIITNKYTGKSGPLGCRIEGLLAYRSILKDKKELKKVDSKIEEFVEEMLECFDDRIGTFKRDPSSTKVRIDDTQHCLCALVRYLNEVLL